MEKYFEKLSFEEREKIVETFMIENEKESFRIFDDLSFEKKKIEDGDFVFDVIYQTREGVFDQISKH